MTATSAIHSDRVVLIAAARSHIQCSKGLGHRKRDSLLPNGYPIRGSNALLVCRNWIPRISAVAAVLVVAL